MTKFNFDATGVGSVPFSDPQAACGIIFDNFPAIPFWPQMVRTSFLENMYVQFSEGLPGIVLDEKKRTINVNAAKASAEIESVYEKYLACDVEYFKISEDYAKGFYAFLRMAQSLPEGVKFLKGQTVGPVSYALSLTDLDKRAVLYDKDLFEVLTKVLAMKARWQIRKLKAFSSGVIIFIDEPSLVSLGSSYVNINAGDAIERLTELITAIKDEGALCGLHCCGNTDWPLLLKSGVDIISFDAYNFTREFLLYRRELEEFQSRGGTIAWGVVPTSDAVAKESPEKLAGRLESAGAILSVSSMITPSCGVGTLNERTAVDIFKMTKEVSKKLKR
ncbi:MAG: hypothetical protein PHS46_06570 [Candidatus Omnitrophica bacterium]|nr:hypothetical protein [Candidatus Omnitrophota bacterium]